MPILATLANCFDHSQLAAFLATTSLLLLTLSPLLLHALAPDQIPRRLLNPTVSLTRIPVLARSFHRIDTLILVLFARGRPGLITGDRPNCRLWAVESQYECNAEWGRILNRYEEVERLEEGQTSAAPLTY